VTKVRVEIFLNMLDDGQLGNISNLEEVYRPDPLYKLTGLRFATMGQVISTGLYVKKCDEVYLFLDGILERINAILHPERFIERVELCNPEAIKRKDITEIAGELITAATVHELVHSFGFDDEEVAVAAMDKLGFDCVYPFRVSSPSEGAGRND